MPWVWIGIGVWAAVVSFGLVLCVAARRGDEESARAFDEYVARRNTRPHGNVNRPF